MSTIRHMLGIVAAGCLVMPAMGQETMTPDGATVLLGEVRTGEPVVDPMGLCGATLYNAPDAVVLSSGRTVGTGSEWIPVQPFTPGSDWNVCGLGVDGWYVTGAPRTVNINIYPDDGSGDTADLNNPLCGAGVDVVMGNSGVVNWVYGDLAERCCLTGGRQYYVAVKPSSIDHWSAVYTHTDFSFPRSYSVNNSGGRFAADPLCVRILGEEGCGGSDLTIDYQGQCPGDVRVSFNGATPGGTVGLVFSTANAGFTIPSGPCAGTSLDIGPTAIQLVGTTTADGSGSGFFSGFAPQVACRGYIQAVDATTCATSNVQQIL